MPPFALVAPAFWYQPSVSWRARALAPLSLGYTLAGWLRDRFVVPSSVGIPVVCVGNINAGGTGKTPIVLALVERLVHHHGVSGVHLLTRGFRGSLTGPILVNPALHDSGDVGDEALLLAAVAPTWVARDRLAGARAAVLAGARLIIMDDGLQNPKLAKDVSLVVVDAVAGFGNGRVMPGGPLREPLTRGLARASAVVMLGGGDGFSSAEAKMRFPVPVLGAALKPVSAGYAGARILAFAGIGRPQKFFATCALAGAEVVEAVAFPDHHRYTPQEMAELRARAAALSATLTTTAKDAIRLQAGEREGLSVISVTVCWDDETALDAVLAPVLARMLAPPMGAD